MGDAEGGGVKPIYHFDCRARRPRFTLLLPVPLPANPEWNARVKQWVRT